jgi:small-conductance mechanosensitive channel
MADFSGALGVTPTGLLSLELAGNFLYQYFEAILAFVAALIVIKIFKFIIIRRLRKLAEKTKMEVDDVLIDIIDHLGIPFYIVVALYTSSRFLTLPHLADIGLTLLLVITVTYYLVGALQKLGDFWLRKMLSDKAAESMKGLFDILLKIFLWTIALLLILSNLGYDITTLVAGLGIAGIAIAFAMQRILEDIFSAFSIYADRPFEVGDFIVIGNDKGTVKHIGLKSTRIQTLQGQELVVSNRELLASRIHNYKKMKKRRITFSFGVTYDTPLKKLKKIPDIVKDIVDKQELAELDRVHFKTFGDFALIYEVVYYMTVPDYVKYMDTQQAINLELIKKFEKEGIEFAFPTQTIYLHKSE